MHEEHTQRHLAGRFGAGRAVMATFGRPQDAAVALQKLLDTGFVNVEQEMDGDRTTVIVDAGDRQDQPREILFEHGGVEFDPPSP